MSENGVYSLRTKSMRYEKPVSSIVWLLRNSKEFASGFPSEERYNLFFSLAKNEGGDRKKFIEQEVIAWDLDKADLSKTEQYIELFIRILNLDADKTGIVNSGNGLHFYVQLESPITDESFFSSNKANYKAVCSLLDNELKRYGLPGSFDTVVFEPARVFRLPYTENRKDLGSSKCFTVRKILKPQKFDITEFIPLGSLKPDGLIHKSAIKGKPIDVQGMLEGCLFFKWMQEKPNEVNEDQWYSGISTLVHVPDGTKITHNISKGYAGYDPSETDQKLSNALASSPGPRTCQDICGRWDGCGSCPHWGKVTSPIQIKRKEFIQTEHTGFFFTKKDGELSKTPDYEGLWKYFNREHVYKQAGNVLYLFNGTHYESQKPLFFEAFAQKHFHECFNKTASEFRGLALRELEEIGDHKLDAPPQKINMQNGVLDLKTFELEPHNPKYFFQYCLPYDYDPEATCPIYDEKYIKPVTRHDEEMELLLDEVMGYAVSGVHPELAEKAFLLYGPSSGNGKTRFCRIVEAMVGKKNVSSVSLADINKDTKRTSLVSSLVNIGDENPETLKSTEIFKKVVSGSEIDAKFLYKDPMEFSPIAKFIFNCNELPSIRGNNDAFFRRTIIIPFYARFRPDDEGYDPFIAEKIIKGELAGVFNRAIKGLKRLKDNGWKFNIPKSCKELSAEYQRDTDSFEGWWHDASVSKGDGWYISRNVYSHYQEYCDEMGIVHAYSQKKFMNRLRTKNMYNPLYVPGIQKKLNGKKLRTIKGIIIPDLQQVSEDEPPKDFL